MGHLYSRRLSLIMSNHDPIPLERIKMPKRGVNWANSKFSCGIKPYKPNFTPRCLEVFLMILPEKSFAP
jgi:hypothetical protein